TRNIAHSPYRVPHATVQVVPVRCGSRKIIIHERPDFVRNAPSQWDVLGGHVTFEMGVLTAENGLENAYDDTAVKEAREEMLFTVNGKPHQILKAHFHRIGHFSRFRWIGAENVEFSTAYVLAVPENAKVLVPFERRDGSLLPLNHREITWDDLQRLHKEAESRSQTEFSHGFADGISRILDQTTAAEINDALSWCGSQTL
ncbi:MAG: hypothetical protein MN733_44200, partial [Nitrososphaera sp.]|nr:hypothetical protein [Nitrososphaera sp.]